jgi:nucleoside-diphosphate-sugar epimerase
MRLLVLGGTRFVGRAVVADALGRGHQVAVVSRGESGAPPTAVEWIRGDRTEQAVIRRLAERQWDAVIDTWGGAAAAVQLAAAALAGAAEWYGYVSSRSVYTWPIPLGADESAPVVDAAQSEGYPADKRAAELAVLDSFPADHLLARAGLILGPHEDTGRLTWWLARAAVGGSMVAPAPPDQPWQCIDARDLAAFLLDAAEAHTTGVFNVVGPLSAGVTTGRLLTACVEATGAAAELVWIEAEVLRRAGVSEWEDLPGWVAPDGEGAGMHDCDVSAAVAAGLSCRPIEHTVADTWQWLREIPPSRRPPRRPGLARRGLSAEQEQAVWWLTGY